MSKSLEPRVASVLILGDDGSEAELLREWQEQKAAKAPPAVDDIGMAGFGCQGNLN